MLLDIWETSWRVPQAIPFVVGGLIVAWGAFSALLAFSGSQRSGQPEIHFPRKPAEIVEEPPTED